MSRAGDIFWGALMFLLGALFATWLQGCSFPRCLCTCPNRSDAYLSYPDDNAKQICRDFCEAACYDC